MIFAVAKCFVKLRMRGTEACRLLVRCLRVLGTADLREYMKGEEKDSNALGEKVQKKGAVKDMKYQFVLQVNTAGKCGMMRGWITD